MIEKELAVKFLNKNVFLTVADEDNFVFRRGRIVGVTDSAIILNFQGAEQVYALTFIEGIREAWKR